LDEPAEVEKTFHESLGNLRRKAQEYRRWDPFHETIVRSLWFYGYEGSLTEPPCSEFGKSPLLIANACCEVFPFYTNVTHFE
jgi:carbonic anhydrase